MMNKLSKNHHVLPKLALPGCFLALGGLFASGCLSGGTLENADEHLAVSGPCDAKPIFEASCAGSLCHQAGNVESPHDFVSPGVESRLYDFAPVKSDCSTEKIINSANPDSSLMITKINGTHNCGEGMPVPYPTTALSARDLACVESWVNELIANPPDSGNGGAGGMGGNL